MICNKTMHLEGVKSMDLFSYLHNDKFFNPLTGVNKQLYFDCICSLIEYSKSVSVLYENDVKDVVNEYLAHHFYQNENDDEDNIVPISTRIINKFRECGWLSKPELGRNGEYVTNVTMHCRRIIDFLNRMINKQDDAAISNQILQIYEIVQSIFNPQLMRKDRPYSLVLSPLMSAKEELKNEIQDLKDNIELITTQIVEFSDLSGVGNFFLADKLLEKFFSDYFFMKHNGLIPSILKGIIDGLRAFKHDTLFQKAIEEYAEKKDEDIEEAKYYLNQVMEEMLYFFIDQYPDEMEYIDEKINKYYRLANMKIRLIMSNGVNLKSSIDEILCLYRDSRASDKAKIIEGLDACIQVNDQKYISSRSYQIKSKESNDDISMIVENFELSDEEKVKITEELMHIAQNAYSVDKCNNYFDCRFKEEERMSIRSNEIKTKEEALMFAAAFIYEFEEDFHFQVKIQDDLECLSGLEISNMIIRRK